jgi:hypothetical protein
LLAITFRNGVENAWNHIAVFIPKFIGFLLILVLGYFVAKAMAGILAKILQRVGFDRAVERGGLQQALARSKYEPSDILGKVVFWAFFLLVLQLAFGVFGPNPISDLIKGIIAFLPNVFVAIVILVIAGALARVVTELAESLLGAVSGGRWIAPGAGVAILVVGFFAALDQLHIAPAIVNGLFYAALAILVGSTVISVGVGGIPTMRRYWERVAAKAEAKGSEIKRQAQSQVSQQNVRARTQEMKDEIRGSGTI